MSNQDPHNEPGKFYSYKTRKGVLPISWEDYFGLCKGLALAISTYDPEIILGVARGGLYAATLLSHMLQAELYTIRITRRLKDQVVYDQTFGVRMSGRVDGHRGSFGLLMRM